MRIVLAAALISVASLSVFWVGAARAQDQYICEMQWREAHASGSPLSRDRFIEACRKGEPEVTARAAFPDPPKSDLTVPKVSDDLPKSLGVGATCNGVTAGVAGPQASQACKTPGGLPQGVK
jgi:hypothetical protein